MSNLAEIDWLSLNKPKPYFSPQGNIDVQDTFKRWFFKRMNPDLGSAGDPSVPFSLKEPAPVSYAHPGIDSLGDLGYNDKAYRHPAYWPERKSFFDEKPEKVLTPLDMPDKYLQPHLSPGLGRVLPSNFKYTPPSFWEHFKEKITTPSYILPRLGLAFVVHQILSKLENRKQKKIMNKEAFILSYIEKQANIAGLLSQLNGNPVANVIKTIFTPKQPTSAFTPIPMMAKLKNMLTNMKPVQPLKIT
jgi:hypothetical protein